MLKLYGIYDDKYGLNETVDTLDKAERVYKLIKENKISNGVNVHESFVSLFETDDNFKTKKLLKKAIAVIDKELTKEIGTPKQNGYECSFWGKWQEI